MSTREQARALMSRHHHLIKQRQQSLLTRAAAQVGLPAEELGSGTRIQGKYSFNAQIAYDRSHSALS
ncbi:MAG: hypothetical protein F6J97_11635 [Leptolyngbya sp. SIO4C1]|nr:hypothetical protein [Leptolyngbya sp. SIO4C1]